MVKIKDISNKSKIRIVKAIISIVIIIVIKLTYTPVHEPDASSKELFINYKETFNQVVSDEVVKIDLFIVERNISTKTFLNKTNSFNRLHYQINNKKIIDTFVSNLSEVKWNIDSYHYQIPERELLLAKEDIHIGINMYSQNYSIQFSYLMYGYLNEKSEKKVSKFSINRRPDVQYFADLTDSIFYYDYDRLDDLFYKEIFPEIIKNTENYEIVEIPKNK